MKTELRIAKHLVVGGASVVEVWYDGAFLATVVGADGPGVRVISKHILSMEQDSGDERTPGVVQVNIRKRKGTAS